METSACEPGNAAFHDPAARLDHESDLMGQLPHDLNNPTHGLLHPLRKTFFIPLVHPELADAPEHPIQTSQQQLTSCTVRDTRGQDEHAQHVEDMSLATLHCFCGYHTLVHRPLRSS